MRQSPIFQPQKQSNSHESLLDRRDQCNAGLSNVYHVPHISIPNAIHPTLPVMQCYTDHKVPSLSYTSSLVTCITPSLPTHHLSPQPLQLPQHHQIRIQKPVHTLPHARLFVLVQLAVLDAARGDALAEARVCEAVDGYFTTLVSKGRKEEKGGKR